MKLFTELDARAYKTKERTLASICPYVTMVDDGVVLLKGGAITCAYEFTAPDLASSSPAKVNSVSLMFNNAVMQLGRGWTVQMELRRSYSNSYPASTFENLAAYLVDRQREMNFSYAKAHFSNRYFLILTYQLPPEVEMRGVSSFYTTGGADRAQDKMRELYRNEIKQFRQTAEKSVAVLKSVIKIARLDDDALFSLLHSSVSLDWGDRILPKEYSLMLDRVLTDSDLENSIPLKLGRHYIPIVTVKSFPDMTVPALFDVLNKAQCPLRWSTRFICYDREQAEKKMDDAGNRFRSRRKSLGQLVAESLTSVRVDKVNEAAVAEESDAMQAKTELYMSGSGYGDYLSNIMVFDEDLETAEDYARYVSGLVTACRFSAKIEEHNALQAFLAMQPGNIYADSRALFLSTGGWSHVIPITSIWSGLRQNKFMEERTGTSCPHVVCGTEFNIPFFLNLNVGNVCHAWISGRTGGGKSTLLNLLAAQWLKYPRARVIIIDKGRTARNLVMCAGGNCIEPGRDDTAFQPLADIDSPEGMRWACDFIEILLSVQNVPVTPEMRVAIFDAVKQLSTKAVGYRTMTSFMQYCDYQDPATLRNDIAAGVMPYTLDGQYGHIFDSESASMPVKSFTMIETDALMAMSAQAVTPALFYIFHECEKTFDGTPVLFIVDEGWAMFKNDIAAAKFLEYLKVLRKKNVGMVFASQETNDAAASRLATTLVSQCPTKIFLPDYEAETPKICGTYKEFGLDDSEIHLLTQMKARDYLYKSPLGTRLFNLALDDLQLAILTPDGAGKNQELLDDIDEKFGKNCGRPLVREILDAKGIDYRHLLEE